MARKTYGMDRLDIKLGLIAGLPEIEAAHLEELDSLADRLSLAITHGQTGSQLTADAPATLAELKMLMVNLRAAKRLMAELSARYQG